MKTLKAKPFDQNAEKWKRECRLFTSTVLAPRTSGQDRIATHALRSHRTVWFVFAAQTLVSCQKRTLLVTKGFCSPNDTPKPRKNCDDGHFSTSLTGMKSCTVDRGYTPVPKYAMKLENSFLSGPFHQIKLLSFSIRQMWTDSWIRQKNTAGLRCVFFRGRPHSMELPTLVLMYSWYHQEYIRTRVGNSILWGLPRQNSKFVIDDAQPLSFQVVMHSTLNTCMLALSRSSIFLTGISG